MNNFDAFIESVKDHAPVGEYTGRLMPKIYKRDALIGWLCECANGASYDMRRIDEDPKKKKELILAIGVAIDIMSGGAILTDVEGYVVDQLITDAAHEYMQSHPSILEGAGHLLRKLFS